MEQSITQAPSAGRRPPLSFKRTISRKMTLLIVGATLFSLLMGAPISYIQLLVFDSGVLSFLGSEVNSILQTYFTLIVNTLILVIVVFIGLRRIVLRPVMEMNETIQQMQGEKIHLDQRVSVRSEDEIGQLGTAFNRLNETMDSIIHSVRSSSKDVADAAEQNAAAVEELHAGTEEVTNNASGMLQQARSGNEAIEEVSQALLELSSLIQIAKEKAGAAEKTTSETLEASEAGRTRLEEITASMEEMRNESKETKAHVASLDDYSKQIHSIVDTITDISEQTNLLALNAAIEAARAGDAGRGFAVVADEVRKLAEQTSNEAENVTGIIEEITRTTARASDAMENNDRSIAAGSREMEETAQMFESIFTSIRSTASNMQDISKVTNEEVATSEKIVSLIDQLATFVESTEKSAAGVSESASETNITLTTIAESTEEMNELASRLREAVSVFYERKENAAS
ncbi:methyl-accepting chemotaxis protein [Alkalicoccus urumqiensis]|nr:HAMP domain-containing methyl-accepting chemotaxis protein [Alkalicoccus urumqiensis]